MMNYTGLAECLLSNYMVLALELITQAGSLVYIVRCGHHVSVITIQRRQALQVAYRCPIGMTCA